MKPEELNRLLADILNYDATEGGTDVTQLLSRAYNAIEELRSAPVETHLLRDFELWRDSLRNYEWIRRVAPGATDIDCLIERHGRFLIFEDKHWRHGVTVPLGQHIALLALAWLPTVSIYLVGSTGDVSDPYRIVPYLQHSPEPQGSHVVFPARVFTPATHDDLRSIVRRWMNEQ